MTSEIEWLILVPMSQSSDSGQGVLDYQGVLLYEDLNPFVTYELRTTVIYSWHNYGYYLQSQLEQKKRLAYLYQ